MKRSLYCKKMSGGNENRKPKKAPLEVKERGE